MSIFTYIHVVDMNSISHDAPVMLQVLYKLKTAKVFEKARGKEEKAYTEIVDEDPFAIQLMAWCPESRMLCVAGVSAHVIVYRFSKQEVMTEVIQVHLDSLHAYYSMRTQIHTYLQFVANLPPQLISNKNIRM